MIRDAVYTVAIASLAPILVAGLIIGFTPIGWAWGIGGSVTLSTTLAVLIIVSLEEGWFWQRVVALVVALSAATSGVLWITHGHLAWQIISWVSYGLMALACSALAFLYVAFNLSPHH